MVSAAKNLLLDQQFEMLRYAHHDSEKALPFAYHD